MNPFWAKLIWTVGVVGWFVIRLPHQRRSKRTSTVRKAHRIREMVLLTISLTGMVIVPAIYVFTGHPSFANYGFQPPMAWLGAAVFACSLWLFVRTHKDLGHNWSVTLEVRDRHALITNGVYSHVRHPMYSAFWLWAVAQGMLLPNWVAGLSGIFGFGTLFFLRLKQEEALMLERFGEEYRKYMAVSWRVLPGIF